MVMFWVQPFFLSLTGNKQTTAGTAEENSDLNITGMTGFMLVWASQGKVELVSLFKTLVCLQKMPGSLKSGSWPGRDPPLQALMLLRWFFHPHKKKKNTTGSPKISCFTLLPTTKSCSAEFWPNYDMTNWFEVLTASLDTSQNYS